MSKKARETLAEFVKRTRLAKGLSLTDVAINSGGEISNGYVFNIEHGTASNPSALKIQALAIGLDVSEDVLFAFARGTKEPEGFRDSVFWEVHEIYERLEKPIHKKTVDYYLRQLIEMMKVMPKRKK